VQASDGSEIHPFKSLPLAARTAMVPDSNTSKK
jgi:hypothetical protein